MAHVIIHLVVILTIIIIVGAISIYLIESTNENAKIKTVLDAVWWTAATVTTVGYGDIVPITDLGRIVGIAYMFVGIAILGLFVSTVGASLIKSRLFHGKEDQTEKNLHIIIGKLTELERLEKSDKEAIDSMKKDLAFMKNN